MSYSKNNLNGRLSTTANTHTDVDTLDFQHRFQRESFAILILWKLYLSTDLTTSLRYDLFGREIESLYAHWQADNFQMTGSN